MQITFWQLIAVFGFGYVTAILMLVGVGMGAYLVFVTKRESAEALFQPFKKDEGGAYIAKTNEVDDIPDDLDGTDVTKAYDGLLGKMNERFLGQMKGE